MLGVLTAFIGGMGLFFAGLKLTSDGVKKIAGRRFRDLFLRYTRNPFSGAMVGILSGMVFQSTSGISLLLASLIGAGATTVYLSIPVLLGANAGVAFLTLVAVIDIKILVLGLFGVSGLIISFEKPARYVNFAGIIFGVSLLLFGLDIVRTGAAPLAEAEWFKSFLATQSLPLPWYFVIGSVACMLLQTSAGVSILAITLAASGIFDMNDALAIIYGSLCGSSLLSRLYAIQLTGAQKRLAMGQVFFNFAGLAIFLPIFILENFGGVPLLQALSMKCFDTLPEQLAAINISFDCVTAIALFLFRAPYNRLLEKLFPDRMDAPDSLTFARELSDVSPETALLLINKEQWRFVRQFTDYTIRLREALERGGCPDIHGLHQRLVNLSGRVEDCLLDILSRGQSGTTANAVALLQSNQADLVSFSETMSSLVTELSACAASPEMQRQSESLMEVIEMLICEAERVFLSADQAEWDLFLAITRDKNPAMEHLRARYLKEECTMCPETKWTFLRATGLFERCAWLLHHLAEQQRKFLSETGSKDMPSW